MRYDTEMLHGMGVALTEHSRSLQLLSIGLAEALAQSRQETALFAVNHSERFDLVRAATHIHERLETAHAQMIHLAGTAGVLADALHRVREHTERNEGAIERVFRQLKSELQQFRRPGELFSSPLFTAGLRAFAANVDWMTAAIIPPVHKAVLPAQGLRRGPNYTAAVLASVTDRFAGLRAKVTVHSKGSATTVTAPRSLADLAHRIPDAQAGKPQMRIEQYAREGKTTWIVYYAGTVQMAPNAKGEPWDGASNLKLMAGTESDSLRAARQAMRAAGIGENDHVVHVGFSQGGILAAQLAAQAPAGTADLVTFGAPVAQIDLDTVDAAIAIEHAEDLVPALGGVVDAKAADRLVITRRAFGEGLPKGEILPAHNLKRYIDTASLVEARANRALRDERLKLFDDMPASVEGENAPVGQSTLWRATRETR